jgi:anti-anti-sigma regulatory factor
MPEAEILVARTATVAQARIVGRATFKVSRDFREFGLRALQGGVRHLILDFSACTFMDSTFMGILTLLAIDSRGHAEILLVNVSPANRALLAGLGVAKLFRYAEMPRTGNVTWESLCRAAAGSLDPAQVAGTVLDAHQALMDADAGNVPRFRNVVELLKIETDKPPRT